MGRKPLVNMKIIGKVLNIFPLKPVLNTESLCSYYKLLGKNMEIKRLVVLCRRCREDREMFYLGYFTVDSFRYKNGKPSGCGCCRGHRWTQKEIEVKVNRVCKELNCNLLYCKSESEGIWKFSDKLVINCSRHGIWDTCTIANLTKGRTCPKCAEESRRSLKTVDKRQRLHDLCDGKYKVVSEMTNKTKLKDRIDVMCSKGHIFNLTVNNFIRGRRCPDCVGKNMDILYVHRVVCSDVNTKLFKVGITKELDHRISTQNSRNNYKFSLWQAWKFRNVKDCKEAERRLKKKLCKPDNKQFIKSNFRDGHSEIFQGDVFSIMDDVTEIIEDYSTYKYIPDKTLSEFWNKLVKPNRVR